MRTCFACLRVAPPPRALYGGQALRRRQGFNIRISDFLFNKEVIENVMAVTMRLMRFGGKKSPFYRIVVSDRRSARDGKFIDQVGVYDPKKNPVEVQFKEEKALDWLRKGAQPTPTVRQLLIKSGVSKKLAEGKVG